jgi:DNA repair protein RecO (recombination protein O)
LPDRLKLTAVVLRTVDYGESDRVVTLFSRERGRLSAFARGARASKRRFGGVLEPFTLVSAELRERSNAGLLTLDSASAERAFGGIRSDLTRIACAGYACELVRELLHDAEPYPDLFSLLVDLLSRLDAAPAHAAAMRAFQLGALRTAGLMPRLDGCTRCGRPVPREGGRSEPSQIVQFDAAQGGIVCSQCAPFASPGSSGLALETLWALLRLQSGGLEAAAAESLSPGANTEARRLLARFIEHHLGRPLVSSKFIDEVAPEIG